MAEPTDEIQPNKSATQRLTERDQRILKMVWRLGVASSSQISRVVFDDASYSATPTANRHLRALAESHYLDRIARSRRQEVAYILGPQSLPLLQPLTHFDIKPVHFEDDEALAHALGLNEFAVQLILATRQTRLRLEWVGKLMTLTRADGSVFEPDGVGILSKADCNRPFFVEWRQGQETDANVARRVQSYLDLSSHPASWQQLSQDSFPPLLFITLSGPAQLHTAVASLPPTTGLAVWWAAWSDLEQQGVLTDVFYQVGPAGFTSPASLLQVVGMGSCP